MHIFEEEKHVVFFSAVFGLIVISTLYAGVKHFFARWHCQSKTRRPRVGTPIVVDCQPLWDTQHTAHTLFSTDQQRQGTSERPAPAQNNKKINTASNHNIRKCNWIETKVQNEKRTSCGMHLLQLEKCIQMYDHWKLNARKNTSVEHCAHCTQHSCNIQRSDVLFAVCCLYVETDALTTRQFSNQIIQRVSLSFDCNVMRLLWMLVKKRASRHFLTEDISGETFNWKLMCRRANCGATAAFFFSQENKKINQTQFNTFFFLWLKPTALVFLLLLLLMMMMALVT